MDDIVLIVDETVNRGCWKTGRVTETLGEAPHIRKVTIKRSDGSEIIRDRTKVVKLELDD